MQSIKSPPKKKTINVAWVTLLSLICMTVVAGLSFAGSGDSLIVRTDGSVEVLHHKNYKYQQVVKPKPESVVYKVMKREDVNKEIRGQFDRRFGHKSHADVQTRWEWADE